MPRKTRSTSQRKPSEVSKGGSRVTKASASTSTMPSLTRTSRNPATAPVFFWREYGSDHCYLSQWYESAFTHEGSIYETAEKWMMVSKARLFGDEDIAQKMLKTTDPGEHRKLGRQVKAFDEKVWNANKMRIVEEGNFLKFTQSEKAEEMRRKLLNTEERELVEASPFDKIWGVGFREGNAEKNRHRWGKNLLGIALMAVRKRLKEQETGEKSLN